MCVKMWKTVLLTGTHTLQKQKNKAFTPHAHHSDLHSPESLPACTDTMAHAQQRAPRLAHPPPQRAAPKARGCKPGPPPKGQIRDEGALSRPALLTGPHTATTMWSRSAGAKPVPLGESAAHTCPRFFSFGRQSLCLGAEIISEITGQVWYITVNGQDLSSAGVPPVSGVRGP